MVRKPGEVSRRRSFQRSQDGLSGAEVLQVGCPSSSSSSSGHEKMELPAPTPGPLTQKLWGRTQPSVVQQDLQGRCTLTSENRWPREARAEHRDHLTVFEGLSGGAVNQSLQKWGDRFQGKGTESLPAVRGGLRRVWAWRMASRGSRWWMLWRFVRSAGERRGGRKGKCELGRR